MKRLDNAAAGIEKLSARIDADATRFLFVRLCTEVAGLGGDIVTEVAPFEIRFRSPSGFLVAVSPYTELFRVTVGTTGRVSIRVSGADEYFWALDHSLKSYLAVTCRRYASSG